MLDNCAQWIAEEAEAFGIPIRRLSANEAQGGAAGVCQHVDLGAAGGGHWDCGGGFPIDRVLAMAAGNEPEPEPEPEPEDDDMQNLTICAGPAPSPQQYVTDMGQFKRPINGVEDWNTTVWCLVASGAKLYYQDINNPIRVPQTTLDAIPTVKT
jgi:hypothetical protein